MKRNPRLDGLRGVAIGMVLLWHYIGGQISLSAAPDLLRLRQTVCLMWSGVDLFFVLSGFLITGILCDERKSPHYWTTFYIRRACRILPLYALLLAGYAIALATGWARSPSMSWLCANPMPLGSYATFTQNIFMGMARTTGANWMGVSWSLAVEEQFYLVLPLIIYLVSRRNLALVFCGAIIAAPVLRAVFPGYVALINTPFKADALCLGGLIALLLRSPKWTAGALRVRGFLWGLLALLAVCFVGMTFRLGPFEQVDLQLSSFSAISLLLLALFFATGLTLILLEPDSVLFRPLGWPVLRWLGTISYAVYLFHQVLSGMLHSVLRKDTPSVESIPAAAVTLLALAATFALAEFSRRHLEGPILRWGHRFYFRDE